VAEEEDQEMLQVARAAHAERERLRLPVSSCPGAPPKAPPGRATAGERPGNRGGELTVVHFVPAPARARGVADAGRHRTTGARWVSRGRAFGLRHVRPRATADGRNAAVGGPAPPHSLLLPWSIAVV